MNDLNILYEDNHIIVVEKKKGILSQSDITLKPDLLSLVKKYIKEKYNKPSNVYVGLVHRLDKNVGGIMVFAKTSKAAKRLNEQIKNHEFNKTYIALLEGKIEKKKGTLTDYIIKNEKEKKAYISSSNDKNAKKSMLDYELLNYIGNNSLVKINLITGRFHQIRCQFSNINHPVVGDIKYGQKKNNNFYLWAYNLEFIHPTTKEKLSFKLLPNWEVLNNETIIY